ncbi:MAG: hypothetical protein JSR81_10685, partial [Proteobacteria bacterium]|nr:hypothetical protein [Pseudomonadota bacterium]
YTRRHGLDIQGNRGAGILCPIAGRSSRSGTLAAKSGGLFGRIRNEIAVIGYPDGASYAVAVFTVAAVPFRATAAINAQIARIATTAIDALR